MHSVWTVYAQYVNSAYAVYNSKNGLPKSTNAGQKKKAEYVMQKTWTRSPNGHIVLLYWIKFRYNILSVIP